MPFISSTPLNVACHPLEGLGKGCSAEVPGEGLGKNMKCPHVPMQVGSGLATKDLESLQGPPEL